MFKINKLERQYLEEIGVLKVIHDKSGKYAGLYVCNVSRKSKKKTYYVNDEFKRYIYGMAKYYNSKNQQV